MTLRWLKKTLCFPKLVRVSSGVSRSGVVVHVKENGTAAIHTLGSPAGVQRQL